MSQATAGMTWVTATAQTDSALVALLPDGANGVWFGRIAAGGKFPAVVVTIQSAPLVNNATGALIYQDALFQIKGVGLATNYATLISIQARLQALFGSVTIQPEGSNTILSCVAEQEVIFEEHIPGDVDYSHLGYLCRIKIQ